MTRRIIPWTFSVGLLLMAALLLTGPVNASRPGAKVPNVRGHWDGFFLDAGGTVGLVRSDIAQQSGRRLSGGGSLLAAATGDRLATFNFSGMLMPDDVITATGKTATGRVDLQSGVQFFAGSRGNAGVMDAQFHFDPRRGQPTRLSALLLHPFPDGPAPDVSGDGAGTFQSGIDPTFGGDLDLQMDARDRGTFPGVLTCTFRSDVHAPFSWASRGTIDERGRLIVIAQGKSGRMIIDGAVSRGIGTAAWGPSLGTEAVRSLSVDAHFSLLLIEGRTDYGAVNFSITPTLR